MLRILWIDRDFNSLYNRFNPGWVMEDLREMGELNFSFTQHSVGDRYTNLNANGGDYDFVIYATSCGWLDDPQVNLVWVDGTAVEADVKIICRNNIRSDRNEVADKVRKGLIERGFLTSSPSQ